MGHRREVGIRECEYLGDDGGRVSAGGWGKRTVLKGWSTLENVTC